MNKAVIMAGGFGTRLRPLTMNIPKPMVPIANVPMMGHIVNLLKNHNIRDIVSLLYFQPEAITGHFEDGSKFGINMNYVLAQADYGTAGSVKNAHEYLNDRFIIISGDVLTDFDISKALKFHEEKGSKATILLTRVTNPLAYGIVITDEEGRITRFLEKPSWGQVFSDTINTGIYILEPEVLDMIPFREEFDFSKDLFPMILDRKMPLYGFVAEGYWRDVGNLTEYQTGQYDALRGNLSLIVNGKQNGDYIISSTANIAPTAQMEDVVIIGDDTVIGDNVYLRDCVIGNNVKIGRGARLNGVTIWDNAVIGDFADLTDDVVCYGVQLGSSVTIAENVFIGDNCNIGRQARLSPNIKLWPNKNVEERASVTRSIVQEDKWLRELFTDARISGLSNIDINPEFGAKLGAAIGLSMGKRSKLLASRDPHKVSRIMKRSITAGLSSVGVNVNDLQTVSIPQTRQELRTGRYDGGFHVRRSHRNPDYSDIIIFNKEGRDISISTTKKIERYYFGEDIKRVKYDELGSITYPERTNEIYINRFMESLEVDNIKERKFKLLVDYSYGLSSIIFPSILGKLGAEVISLNNYIDASKFHPDPTMQPLESGETGRIMRSLNYELGFRMDPGAEKISLIDERGVWYSPMRLLTILTKLFLETHRKKEPYKIAISIVAGSEIDEIAKDYNVEIVRIKNSHSAMMESTRDESVLFAGGIYGGYIFSDFLFASDGMFTIGQILEMLAKSGHKISKLDETLPRRYQHSETVEVPWELKGLVMRRAMDHSDKLKRELVEGVKIFTEQGDSVLLLPAKETASFVVYSESDQFDMAESLAKKYISLINQWKEEGNL
ncbi:MAG: sugar phosphate nucleotidyltransferase [Candidatus Kapaibacterium sp.]